MKFLGLTGLAGSGKSTIAREFVLVNRAVPMSFAREIKVAAAAFGHCPLEEVFGPAGKSEATRKWLQVAGTELGRDKHGKDIWVLHAQADCYRLIQYGVPLVVFDDVRFPNEAQWILDQGGLVVRLKRDGAGLAGAAGEHASETEVANVPISVEVDNNRSAGEVRKVIARLLFDDPFTQTRE
jgi:hypothetical protein